MARTKTSQKAAFYATGRRKTAIARVWLMPGKGSVVINRRPIEQYFGRKVWELTVRKPLELTKLQEKFDIIAKAHGGGVAGQAGAIRHGIARALVNFDEELRVVLKRDGLLTRDPREKERKKYGRKRARKGFQWTKR